MYDDDEYGDYHKQLQGCNLMQGMRIEEGSMKCYNQSVIDDLRVERNEYTGLALHLKNAVSYTKVSREHARIEIRDNDREFTYL